MTAIQLHADDGRIGSDGSLSVDLDLEWRMLGGNWLAYIESSSSLPPAPAAAILSEANADAGTAVDRHGHARVQLSQLNYSFTLRRSSEMTVGLLDPTSYLDRTRITNDENMQFIGSVFVNNPTIEFPDYALGGVYQYRPEDRRFRLTAVLTGSNGLADNPARTYEQLIELGSGDKGAFASVSVSWSADVWLVRAGTWMNGRPRPPIANDAVDRRNHGLFGVFDRSVGPHSFGTRVGLASEHTSEAARFAALAYRYRLGLHRFGLSVARTWLSDAVDAPDRDDSHQLEIFARIALLESLHATLSLQKLRHAGFESAAGDPRKSIAVAALRLRYEF